MASPELGAAEQTFTSADVCRIAQISSRQLQWWDERKLVSPRHEDHRRMYLFREVFEVLTIAALREKGVSLQKVHRVLRLLRREFDQYLKEHAAGEARLYLLTDCQSVHLDTEPLRILERLAVSRKPMYLICLNDLLQRIAPDLHRPRRDARQLALF